MEVLGLDPSLSMTGMAKTTASGVILTGRVPTSPFDGEQLGAVRARVRYIVGAVMKFAPAECLTVIEAPIVVRNGRGGMQLERAWLFGMLVDQLIMRGPVVQVRTKTRAMYAASNGNAGKPEVLAAMRARFPDLQVRDDNVADALALLSLGARHLGRPVDGVVTAKQLSAVTAVNWGGLSAEL
jgi:Holliday junction resolvasome RuvABC endonuclease subunit